MRSSRFGSLLYAGPKCHSSTPRYIQDSVGDMLPCWLARWFCQTVEVRSGNSLQFIAGLCIFPWGRPDLWGFASRRRRLHYRVQACSTSLADCAQCALDGQ